MFPQLDIGKNGEKFVNSIFVGLEFISELNDIYSLRYDYDISVDMDKLKFTIECKNDQMSAKTGNIALEYFNSKSNKPSGIYVTKADIWVHLIPNKDELLAYAISVSKLKCFMETAKPFKHIIAGGDKNSDMLIYKMEKILPEFSRFDNISDRGEMKALFSELLLDRV